MRSWSGQGRHLVLDHVPPCLEDGALRLLEDQSGSRYKVAMVLEGGESVADRLSQAWSDGALDSGRKEGGQVMGNALLPGEEPEGKGDEAWQ